MTTDISLVRWDPTLQQEIVEDYEYDGGNSSSRLFERSRIKALAGKGILFEYIEVFTLQYLNILVPGLCSELYTFLVYELRKCKHKKFIAYFLPHTTLRNSCLMLCEGSHFCVGFSKTVQKEWNCLFPLSHVLLNFKNNVKERGGILVS
jgi:hypothetical protein